MLPISICLSCLTPTRSSNDMCPRCQKRQDGQWTGDIGAWKNWKAYASWYPTEKWLTYTFMDMEEGDEEDSPKKKRKEPSAKEIAKARRSTAKKIAAKKSKRKALRIAKEKAKVESIKKAFTAPLRVKRALVIS